jgi:hypothetical protein
MFANSTGGTADVMLPNTGVVANSYGHSTAIPVVTVDAQGRVTTITLANTVPHHDAAYANAVSVANTTSFNQAANAYANVFNGGTFTGAVNMQANLVANSVTLSGSMQIDGNLIVTGNTVTMNVSSLSVEDNMIYLNASSNVANPDLGIAGNYNDGTYRHAGVFRDATDGVWKFFHQYVPEPDASAYIDTANNTFALANVQGNFFIGSITGAANSASYLGGNTASDFINYSSNASNITTGTLSNSRLSNVHTVSSDPNTSGPGTMAIGSNSSFAWVQSHGSKPLLFNPAGNQVRSPKIFDINNTDYYLEPASTSRLNTINIAGGIGMATNNVARNMWFRGYGSSDVGISFYSDSGWCAQFYANYNDAYGFLNGNWAAWDLRKIPNGNLHMNNNNSYYLKTNGTSQLNYVLADDWFRAQGNSGFYTQDYGSHFRRSNSASHGAWELYGYNKGSYCGVNVIYTYYNNLMYDSDGNGGVYQENGQGWHFYFHRGNDCMGISGSTTASGYAIRPNGNQYTDGYIYASAYYYTSDERKKSNITTIPNALEKVLQLRGVNFNWKDNAKVVAGRRSGGLIAQEVLPIIPEAIFEDVNDTDVENALGLDTTPIIGYLVEAIKELKQEIDSLKNRLGE